MGASSVEANGFRAKVSKTRDGNKGAKVPNGNKKARSTAQVERKRVLKVGAVAACRGCVAHARVGAGGQRALVDAEADEGRQDG